MKWRASILSLPIARNPVMWCLLSVGLFILLSLLLAVGALVAVLSGLVSGL